MKVKNIHWRKIKRPKNDIVQLFNTLATTNDMVWPQNIWPAMRFKDGLKIGSKGGHGIIRYTIIDFKEKDSITFEFTKPTGFIGTHELRIEAFSEKETVVYHKIKMNTKTIKATFFWMIVIRWLHDALIEDAFDNIENHFLENKRKTTHSLWVKILRYIYKRKAAKSKLQLG